MSPENFCFWLQGYLELATAGDVEADLTEEQVRCVKDHLALVFQKVTPQRVSKKKSSKRPPLGELADRSDLNFDQKKLIEALDETAKKEPKQYKVTCDTRAPIGGAPWSLCSHERKYC